MHRKILAIILIVAMWGGYKLGMYELKRYFLSDAARPPAGPANGGGGSRGTLAP